MGYVFLVHRIVGEQVLPLLIIIVAIVLTVTWRPGAGPDRWARLFPVLVDIQATLGLIWWIYGIVALNRGPQFLSFPFILHPLLGLLSAGVAHMAVTGKGPFRRLGRWAALAGLGVLLVLVLATVVIGKVY